MKYRDNPLLQWRASTERCFYMEPEDYKDVEELKSCHSEFHRIL